MSQLAGRPKTELIAAYVDSSTRDRLLALARIEDRSVSAVIRRAVGRELERHTNDEQEDEHE